MMKVRIHRGAIHSIDGRIKHGSSTFWTDQASLLALTATEISPGIVSNKDGRTVTRGGGTQMIPGFITGTIAYNNLSPLNGDEATGLK